MKNKEKYAKEIIEIVVVAASENERATVVFSDIPVVK